MTRPLSLQVILYSRRPCFECLCLPMQCETTSAFNPLTSSALTLGALCCVGQAPAVSVVPRHQGAGVGDGVSHPLHQGDRRAPRTGGTAHRAQEWTGQSAVK